MSIFRGRHTAASLATLSLGILRDTGSRQIGQLFTAITGKYPSTTDRDALGSVMGSSNTREFARLVGRSIRHRDSQRLEFIHIDHVIDVTRYAFAPNMSGIPRVVRLLLESKPGRDWTPVVWDRGALCPVAIDDQGRIAFPADFWRADPTLFTMVKLFSSVRKSRWGAVLLSPLERIGFVRLAGRWFLHMAGSPTRSSRARVNVDLRETRLYIPEVPDELNSQRISNILSEWGNVDVTVFIHDLLPLSHPEFFTTSSISQHVELMKVASMSRQLVTSTPILRDAIHATLGGLFGQCPPIHVAGLPIDSRFVPKKSDTPRQHLCFIGGFGKRKSVTEMLAGWEESVHHDLSLKIVGDPSPLRLEEMAVFRRARRISGVELLGSVEDSVLREEMASAIAVAYLSPAEGYGLPIIESLSLGTPVICADTPINRYFAEQYGGLVLVPIEGRTVSLSGLVDILNDKHLLASLRGTIRADSLPRDTDIWAKQAMPK